MTTTPLTIDVQASGGMVAFSWIGLPASQAGDAAAYGSYADKTVQVDGTFGGTVTIQGSNDINPVTGTWFTLTSNLGTNLTFTSSGMNLIAEAPRWIRPSAGSGVSSVNVKIVANQA